MKNTIIICISIFFGILCISCTSKESAVEVKKIDGEELYVCDVTMVKDSIIIPLSDLVKNLHIIKMDDSPEALLGQYARIDLSENYIGFISSQQPFKLFDKTGKYIGNIGNVGRGPGEYLNVYCMQIDEESGSIYILPWQSDYLLRYDLSGEFQNPIKLASWMPKGTFKVKNNKITGLVLPFPNLPYVAFYQNLEGNIIDTIAVTDYLRVGQDYSHEINSFFNGDDPDLYIFNWESRQDSLYHYIGEKGKLVPRFTVKFPDDVPLHELGELPNHYHFSTQEQVQTSANTWTNRIDKNIIVDKKKKEAYFYRIEDDMLFKGDNVSIYRFTNKKFIYNCPAYEFMEKAEKTLARNDVSEEIRKKLNDILDGLDENDNNILIWGEMK